MSASVCKLGFFAPLQSIDTKLCETPMRDAKSDLVISLADSHCDNVMRNR
jgi:hypothetical protein